MKTFLPSVAVLILAAGLACLGLYAFSKERAPVTSTRANWYGTVTASDQGERPSWGRL